MTRIQQLWIAALSAVATIVILTAGPGAASDDNLAKQVAALKPQTIDAPLPAAPEPAPVSDDSATEEVAEAPAEEIASVPEEYVPEAAPSSELPVEEPVEDETPVAPPEEEAPKPSKIKHVFVITLAGRGYDAAFGAASTAPYLATELRPKGALLTGYASLGRGDMPDYIAMAGGQPPNDETSAGCPTYTDIPLTAKADKQGTIEGTGCVYPNTVTTIGDQLSSSKRTWRAYVEDLEKGVPPKTACRRPDANAADDTLKARPGDGYATRHNPFVYYRSLLDLGGCDSSDLPLTGLEADLAKPKDAPSLSFIVPNLCNDGTESPCIDGSPGGLPAADAFLRNWVPKILASPNFEKDGLLVINFAGAAAPDATGAVPPNGALLISPFAQAGSTVAGDYDPYSLLRSLQDLLALKPLAKSNDAKSFAGTVLAKAMNEPVSDD